MPYLRNYSDDLELSCVPEVVHSFPVLRADSMIQCESRCSKSLADGQKNTGCTINFDITQAGPASNQIKDGARCEDATHPSRASIPPAGLVSRRNLRIDSCPVRLTPMVPPVNYGAVERGTIYRSGFPNEYNIRSLVDTTPSDEYHRYVRDRGINRVVVSIAPNKNGNVGTTTDSLCEALMFALNSTHYPLYIHCNQGRHRTGCLIGCLRKLQQRPLAEILAEYDAYASPKVRPGDIDLITSFDPEVLYRYIESRGMLDARNRATRMPFSRFADVYPLADDPSGHTFSPPGDSAGLDEMCTTQISTRQAFTIQPSPTFYSDFTMSDEDDDCAVELDLDEADSRHDFGEINQGVRHGSTKNTVMNLDTAPSIMACPHVENPPSPSLTSAAVS